MLGADEEQMGGCECECECEISYIDTVEVNQAISLRMI